MGTNDVVYLMALDLRDLCDLTIVDTGIYSGNKEQWYRDDYSYSSKRPIRWLNEQMRARRGLQLYNNAREDCLSNTILL